MTVWDWAWLAWGVLFCVIEGMALFNSVGGDTLSEHVWAFLGIRNLDGRRIQNPGGWARLRRFITLAFLAWLSVHLLTGGIF